MMNQTAESHTGRVEQHIDSRKLKPRRLPHSSIKSKKMRAPWHSCCIEMVMHVPR